MVITYLHIACTKIYSYGNLSLNVDDQNTPKHGLIFFNLAWRLCARLVASLPTRWNMHQSPSLSKRAHTRALTHTTQWCTWTQIEPVKYPPPAPPENLHHRCPEICQRGQKTGTKRG